MWRVQHHEDHAAFARLVGRWEQPIRRLCARMLGDSHRAEDLSQEAFARVFAHRRNFDPAGRFSTWLWRIALNLCYDELRRRARRPELSLSAEENDPMADVAETSPAPDESLERSEKLGEVRSALQQLGEPYRTVVILRHFENLKFCEIAEVLGIPEGTVKSRMAEGLARLARRLKPERVRIHQSLPNTLPGCDAQSIDPTALRSRPFLPEAI